MPLLYLSRSPDATIDKASIHLSDLSHDALLTITLTITCAQLVSEMDCRLNSAGKCTGASVTWSDHTTTHAELLPTVEAQQKVEAHHRDHTSGSLSIRETDSSIYLTLRNVTGVNTLTISCRWNAVDGIWTIPVMVGVPCYVQTDVPFTQDEVQLSLEGSVYTSISDQPGQVLTRLTWEGIPRSDMTLQTTVGAEIVHQQSDSMSSIVWNMKPLMEESDQTAQGERPPRHIMFVLDHSGSMETGVKNAVTKKVGTRIQLLLTSVHGCFNVLAGTAHPEDLLTVAWFHDKTIRWNAEPVAFSDMNQEKWESLSAWLDASHAFGGTDIMQACDALLPTTNGQPTRFVIYTDGDMSLSQTQMEQLRETYSNVIYTTVTLSDDANQTVAQRMAHASGGRVFHVSTDDMSRPVTLLRAAQNVVRSLFEPELSHIRCQVFTEAGDAGQDVVVEPIYSSIPSSISVGQTIPIGLMLPPCQQVKIVLSGTMTSAQTAYPWKKQIQCDAHFQGDKRMGVHRYVSTMVCPQIEDKVNWSLQFGTSWVPHTHWICLGAADPRKDWRVASKTSPWANYTTHSTSGFIDVETYDEPDKYDHEDRLCFKDLSQLPRNRKRSNTIIAIPGKVTSVLLLGDLTLDHIVSWFSTASQSFQDDQSPIALDSIRAALGKQSIHLEPNVLSHLISRWLLLKWSQDGDADVYAFYIRPLTVSQDVYAVVDGILSHIFSNAEAVTTS